MQTIFKIYVFLKKMNLSPYKEMAWKQDLFAM
jgi:hypothetical protein